MFVNLKTIFFNSFTSKLIESIFFIKVFRWLRFFIATTVGLSFDPVDTSEVVFTS